jgi:hypothetical protein
MVIVGVEQWFLAFFSFKNQSVCSGFAVTDLTLCNINIITNLSIYSIKINPNGAQHQ